MKTEYDAIVIGTGVSGGWAAKELCEKGLKTLVLERGRMLSHPEDYTTANMDHWDFPSGVKITNEIKKNQPKQSRTGYVNTESTKHMFVDDLKHPYNEDKPFNWIRGYHVGGRSLTWGRQSHRLTKFDFEGNAKEGIAVDWPIRYEDMAPWYDYVEEYIGVSGENLGLPQYPSGKLLKPMELTCVENVLKETLAKKYDDRVLTIGRVAHITEGTKPGKGRVSCQYRNRCRRGCPYGAYFSSNSSTLPAAEDTGNMTLRPNSVVYEIAYPTYEIWKSLKLASRKKDGIQDKYYIGKRPNGIYIPKFRNIGGNTNRKDFLRGYGYQGGGSRGDWTKQIAELSYGKDLKEAILKPGGWTMGLTGFGEILPYHDNRMYLNYDKKDRWGLPTVTFDASLKENELNMRKDMQQQAIEMLEAAGFKEVKGTGKKYNFGNGIHEMGTARMGRDPKTSVLNKYNQIHSVKNVFVTDGAAMTSGGNVNPSLTYMALTARAVDYAVKELNKRNL